MSKIHPKNTLLVDVDGVLLDWESGFSDWMARLGFTRVANTANEYLISKRYNISSQQAFRLVSMFNESARIGFLNPLRDAPFYIKKLHEEHGFKFHCITSLTEEIHAVALRKINLARIFGMEPFGSIVCLPTGGSKREALNEYSGSGCYWIEDKPENAEVGKGLGLRSLLVDHEYNADYKNSGIPRVKNWREIYDLVTS